MVTERIYRGIPYQPSSDEISSNELVDHAYQGNHYETSMKHQNPKTDETTVPLSYRGQGYLQRKADASKSMNS